MYTMNNRIKNNVKTLKDINQKFIEENERIQEYILKEKFKEILKVEENESLCDEIYVNYFKNSILYIKVLNSSSRHYIHTNKNKILEKLKKEIEFSISDINIRIK